MKQVKITQDGEWVIAVIADDLFPKGSFTIDDSAGYTSSVRLHTQLKGPAQHLAIGILHSIYDITGGELNPEQSYFYVKHRPGIDLKPVARKLEAQVRLYGSEIGIPLDIANEVQ